MARTINLAVAHDSGLTTEWVAAHFSGQPGIVIVEVVGSLETGIDRIQRTDADLLLVACATQTELALALVAKSAAELPDRPVVVLAQESSNGFVREAFEAGAEDLVVLRKGPVPSPSAAAEVVFAVEKAMARRAAPEGSAGSGSLICVLGPKGGIGKTLTSCNLGVSLADRGHRVVLVDLDLQFGDLALSLRLHPDKTIYDLATSGGSLDAEKVEAFLATHVSGVRVLLAPIRPDQASTITVDFLREVYRLLAESYDFVIVDTPPGFSPEVIATIDMSSQVCMIGMLDALSLKNTKLGLETLELMGYPENRIRLVLNRADTNVGISHSDVVSIIGRAPDVLVPSTRDITRSVNDGTPIATSAKRSEGAKAFHALAQIYDGERPLTTTKRPARSLLSRGRS